MPLGSGQKFGLGLHSDLDSNLISLLLLCHLPTRVGSKWVQLSWSLNNGDTLWFVANPPRHHGGAAQPGPPETGAAGGSFYGRSQRQHRGQHWQRKRGNQSESEMRTYLFIYCLSVSYCSVDSVINCLSLFQGLTNNECSNHSFGSLGSSSDKESEVNIFNPMWELLWSHLHCPD